MEKVDTQSFFKRFLEGISLKGYPGGFLQSKSNVFSLPKTGLEPRTVNLLKRTQESSKDLKLSFERASHFNHLSMIHGMH